MIARKDALITLSILSSLLLGSTAFAQTAEPATAPAPTVAPVPEVPVATQPFLGVITSDKVYVRSGPGSAYYEMGQLAKGDLVQVMGSSLGWYKILPPNGTFCIIAKEFVETDASGETGTVKGDYIRVRAGTALNKNREPSAVLTVVRKGTKLTIVGSTDKYYEVAPPEKAYVCVNAQFVKPAEAGATYKVPDLKLPPGTTGPSKVTVTAPTTLPPAQVEVTHSPAPESTQPPANTTATVTDVAPGQPPAQPPTLPTPRPVPANVDAAYARLAELDKRYQDELHKPVGHRDFDPLIKDYKDFAAKDLPPSAKITTTNRIADLEKLATIQRLQKESTASADAIEAQRKAYHQDYASAEKALEEYERTGPYLAQGTLQTSTAVTGKYALVNPATGRTEAYVDPKSAIDIASLMGKYIGVRGTTKKAEGTDITVIQVKNATLLPAPNIPTKQNP